MILREAESKLRANQERNVKNSTAYTMAVLFNCIAESESDLRRNIIWQGKKLPLKKRS